MQRVRGCARVRTGARPKKRPTRRGTSLGMVSLAKRTNSKTNRKTNSKTNNTDGGGVYVWDLVGGGGVFLGFLIVVHVLDEFEDSEGDVLD